jgi:hypothetical protein
MRRLRKQSVRCDHAHMSDNDSVSLLAETNWRNNRKRFGIRQADRRHHMYVIGKTGTGKSTLLATLLRQDIEQGRGVALVDPHGDLVERAREWVPEGRRDDLIHLDVPNVTQPLGFNPLERVPPLKRPFAASGLLDVFKKIWADSWGPRLEYVLRNALLTLLDQPEATLADVLRLLDDRRTGETPRCAAGTRRCGTSGSKSSKFILRPSDAKRLRRSRIIVGTSSRRYNMARWRLN